MLMHIFVCLAVSKGARHVCDRIRGLRLQPVGGSVDWAWAHWYLERLIVVEVVRSVV